jgi:tRNA(Ile)-lysidine synthase
MVKEKFLKQLNELGVAETDRLLLAVSGGHDSMVMAHLFQSCNYSFSVAHVNFQLRGDDSDRDEQFVQDWCSQNKIPFFCQRVETNNYAIENKLSIQMAARDLRYAWFNELLDKNGFQYVVTAHHLNDSIETVLINLARGTGLEGLTGISTKSGNLIRPLLFASRTDLENYAAEHEVTWREDSSNASDDYQRNFIRHHIIPAFKKLNPSFEETIRETLSKINSEFNLLKTDLEVWKDENFIIENERIKIKKSGLELPEATARLWHCIKDFGFRFSTCEYIILAMHGQPGKQFLTNSYKLIVDRDFLELVPIHTNWSEVFIDEGQVETTLGTWRLQILKTNGTKHTGKLNEASLDFEKLSFPLVWRKWRAGDSFYPLGMTQRKKISDFLIDRKVSVAEKDSVTVLESGGEIVWLAGHRIDNRFRLTDSTSHVITFSISHI